MHQITIEHPDHPEQALTFTASESRYNTDTGKFQFVVTAHEIVRMASGQFMSLIENLQRMSVDKRLQQERTDYGDKTRFTAMLPVGLYNVNITETMHHG